MGQTPLMSDYDFNPNSIDSKLTELLTLQRLDKEDRDKWRGEFNRKIDDVSNRLESVEFQCKKTNGSVLRHTDEIAGLVKNKQDIDQIVAVKKVAVNLASSKTFWVASLAILFFGVSTGFFSELFKWVFSTVGLN